MEKIPQERPKTMMTLINNGGVEKTLFSLAVFQIRANAYACVAACRRAVAKCEGAIKLEWWWTMLPEGAIARGRKVTWRQLGVGEEEWFTLASLWLHLPTTSPQTWPVA